MIEEMLMEIFRWLKDCLPIYGPHLVMLGSFLVAAALYESTREKYWGD